jgi:uncharacterized protein YggE
MKMKGFLAVAGMLALLTIGLACSNGEAANTPAGTSGNTPPAAVAPGEQASPPVSTVAPSIGMPAPTGPGVAPSTGASGAAPAVAVPPMPPVAVQPVPRVETGVSAPSAAPIFSGMQSFQTGNWQTGIWVTGEGVISLEPDLALLNVGVEATGKTVKEARDSAARAMDAIMAALHARGIEDRDVQTQYFNIYPQYEYVQDTRGVGKQILVGYTVSNTVSVKVRKLADVGNVIDDVAQAGGDATRVNGISFTVENPKPFENELRAMAVKDAMAKAQQFGSLTGVTVGKLVFISEVSGAIPVYKDFARGAVLESAAVPMTPISGGQLEIRLSVQAVFEIE